MVDMELHPSLKNVLNLLVCIKPDFILTIFLSFFLIYSLVGYNRNKNLPPATTNFKKMGAIPCGCNTK
jgi:hypothetical protein